MARLELRLTPQAKKDIQNKAETSGTTISEIVRQSVRRTQTWTVTDKQSIARLTAEIARIGNNLNQIARWCNCYKAEADIIQVTSHLLAISRELKKCTSNFYTMVKDHARKP